MRMLVWVLLFVTSSAWSQPPSFHAPPPEGYVLRSCIGIEARAPRLECKAAAVQTMRKSFAAQVEKMLGTEGSNSQDAIDSVKELIDQYTILQDELCRFKSSHHGRGSMMAIEKNYDCQMHWLHERGPFLHKLKTALKDRERSYQLGDD